MAETLKAATLDVVIDVNALTQNQGDIYPLKEMVRSGETALLSTTMKNLILNVRVVRARIGYYYGIRYIKNGVAGLSGGQDGWEISANPIADYATASLRDTCIGYSDPAPNIDRTAGIQTIYLKSPRGGKEEFYITIDPTKLPAFGTKIAGIFPGEALYSQIIDPSCYEYVDKQFSILDDMVTTAKTGLYVSGSAATKLFSFVFPHGATNMMRITMGINGYNDLFNMRSVELAPFGDVATASWTLVNSYSTDWFPPMVVQAVNNGDAHFVVYTGGNHGSSGSASELQTAVLNDWTCEIDGYSLAPTDIIAGYCNKVTFRWVNALCAYNTIVENRKVLHQTIVAHIQVGGIEAYCDVTALEPIIVKTDNGPQMVTSGYQETCHFLGGQQQGRVAFANALNSGMKSVAPTAWADVCGSAAYGYQISWMDRSYGVGDGRYVGGTAGYMRQGGSGNTKHYHAAVASYSVNMDTGESYQWHGGYSWVAASDVSGEGLDCAFRHKKLGKPVLSYSFTSAGNGLISLPSNLVGTVVGSSVVGPKGLKVFATGYTSQTLSLS